MASETTDSTDLLIAGLVHRIPWSREQVADLCGHHFVDFVVSNTDRPDMTIDFPGDASELALSPHETLEESGDILKWSGRAAAIRLDFDQKHCSVQTVHPANLRWVLRFITGALLSRRDGILVHAAGLVHEGRGYLYLGPSGAGKSTLARIAAARGDLVLCDEAVAVRFGGDQPFLHATPYTRPKKWIGAQGSAPLAGIFFLDRTRPLGSTRTPASQALLILARALFFRLSSAQLGSAFLTTATRLATTCPTDLLSYRLESAPWPPGSSR